MNNISMTNGRKFVSFWLMLVPDLVLFYVALFITIWVRYPEGLGQAAFNTHFKIFTIVFIIWLLIFFIHGLFETQSFRRYTSLFFNLISASVINFFAAVFYFYFQPSLILTPRRFLLVLVGISFILLLVWNLLLKYFLKNRLVEELYLFSFNQELKDLEEEINKHSFLGIKVVGHLNEQTLPLVEIKKGQGIILPENIGTKPEVLSTFFKLRTLEIPFYNFRVFYERLLRRVYLSQLSEAWFLENVNYKEKRFYNLVKRIIDLSAGILAIVPLVVTFPIIAILIKLTSKGPIFFVQERVGKNGKIFKVYKYRTMSGGATNTWTSVNDPRITLFGKFLRKSRLDELPQFINLFLGNMSLVGSRPEQPHIVESLKKQVPFYDERHLVKPGITGWAQLNNTYAGSTEETKVKLQYDLYYIKHRSFLFDLEIILKTIYYIFTWGGR